MIKRLVFGAVAGAVALFLPLHCQRLREPEFNGGSYGDDYLGGTLNLMSALKALLVPAAITSKVPVT